MPSASRQVTGCLAVMVMVLGLPAAWVGALVALHDPEARPVGVMMLLAGLAMMSSPLRDIRRHRRDMRRERQHRADILAGVGRPPAVTAARGPGPAAPRARTGVLPSGERVLAHWTYEGEQWSAYAQRETGGGCMGAVGVTVAVYLLSLYLAPEGSPALAVALVAGAAFVVIHLLANRRAYPQGESGPAEAIITPTALLLSGRYEVLSGGQFHLLGVRYAPHDAMLYFTVGGRGTGPSPEELRVPVPPGCEAEAKKVEDTFRRTLFDAAHGLPPNRGAARKPPPRRRGGNG